MRLRQSKMTSKLEDLYAINTNTLTNPHCIKLHAAKGSRHICPKCYSFFMLEGFRKNCAEGWEENSQLLSTTTVPLADLLDFKPKGKLGIYRFHGHGELINSLHLKNLVGIAVYSPETTFALWTKNPKGIVTEYFKHHPIPDNLVLIYSNPVIDDVMREPRWPFHRVFNVVSESHPDENCTGQQCKDCQLCYTSNETVIIEKEKIYVKQRAN